MLRLILLITLCSGIYSHNASAQNIEPNGELTRYMVQIDFQKAYISGIYILREQDDGIICSIVNEFGVSALTLAYDATKCKVNILGIIKQLDKFYIRKVLKADFKRIIPELCGFDSPRDYKYTNPRRNITYAFTVFKQAPDA